jgi:hypothetical protein
MRKLSLLLAFLLCVALLASAQTSSPSNPTASAPKPVSQVLLPDGTPVMLRVGAAINTANVRVGDQLELSVEEEVRANDVVVVPVNGIAQVVVTSDSSLDAAKTGKISVSLRYVVLADGEKVALRPTKEKKATTNATVVSAGEGDVQIGNGGLVIAYVNGNPPLDLSKMRLASQPTSELKIASTPSGADVSVDGKVVGTTPFAGPVVRGDHVVTVRVAGFQMWKQTVRVGTEPATLQLALKKQDGLESTPQPVSAPASLGELARSARAKKGTPDGQKPASEPIELLPGEQRPGAPPQN